MRFADILVDLASVVKASRSVASKHIELRAHQLDRYGQTSSILRSLRQQETRPSQKTPAAAHTETTTTPPEQPRDVEPKATPEAEQESQSYNAPVETRNLLRDDTPLSSSEQPHVHRSLFRSDPPRKPEVLRPDRGAILSELKRSAGVVTQQGKAEFTPQPLPADHKAPKPKVPDDIPPDVNVEVFHTSRGSQILGGQDQLPRKNQPHVRPPTPSWFKDFGHKKSEAKEVDSPISPSSEELSNTASQPSTQETPSATSTGAAPVEAVTTSPSTDVRDEQTENKHTNTVNDVSSQTEEKETELSEPMQTISSVSEPTTTTPTYTLRESKVPATRLSRMWNYGGLAAGMVGGAISESFSRGLGGGGSGEKGSVLLSAGNMERLVSKLSRMRGAALKLGQMMSFQDAKMLPAPIQEVLQRVQDRADYMPAWQRDRVLAASLGGPDWRERLFGEFDEKPMAAASIGQVHRATLKSTGERVAVKIQFPGVADSIHSDLDNLSLLLTASKMLPKGLYLDKTIANARTELGWECDYEREAACGRRYRDLLADERDVFAVPRIFAEASGKHVLTMEFMEGEGVTRAAPRLAQDQRDWIGAQVLRLCLREITEFRFMQTDPNWTNFLYDDDKGGQGQGKLALLDFGASREFPAPFVARYVALLAAAARADREAVVALSQQLGYLTGHESRAMLDAHVASILTLAEPFLASAPDVYDFRDQTITERVRGFIPVMVRERLSPPPEETYSLHRKLSGAFLLCARLGSRVRCREMFARALEKAGESEEIGGELRKAQKL